MEEINQDGLIHVNSPSNKTIKYIISLHTKKGRSKHSAFFVEGKKVIDEICYPWEIELYVYSQSYLSAHGRASMEKPGICVVDSLFQTLCDTVTPQGILAVVKQHHFSIGSMLSGDAPLLLMLDEIRDPGNLGAMVRIADAVGADGVLLSSGCGEIYNPKVVRSAAGSLFHIPFVKDMLLEQIMDDLKQKNIRIYAAHLDGAKNPYGLSFCRGTAFVIGNEAHGVRKEIADMADDKIKIPMIGRAESLNAAVASGILLYEAVRQRQYCDRKGVGENE